MSKRARYKPKWDQTREAWILNIPAKLSKTGKRSRLIFKEHAEAMQAAYRLKKQADKFGTSLASLDPIRLAECAESYKRLDALGTNFSLLSIVQGWIHQTQAKNVSVTLPEAFNRYVEAKTHLSAVHKQQIGSVKARFEKMGAIGALTEIQPQDIESILSPLASGSRNRYMRIIKAVWNYAIRKGWAKDNPIEKLDFVILPRKSVQIFSNEQIAAMLQVSLNEHLEMLPYFALGAFAGIRIASGELYKLLWSDISFDEKQIKIRSEISKTHSTRFIPMPDCLNAWLTVYLTRTKTASTHVLTLPYGTLRKVRKRIFQIVSPGKTYIPAGLRHSYASAMINSGKGIDATCLALGHVGSPTMLWNHYYMVSSRELAEAYWQIFP